MFILSEGVSFPRKSKAKGLREVYLSASSGVLSRPTGNEFGIIVLQQVVIETHMFFLREDGVVGFEAVFF